ncbi:MAG: riboflavin synthase [Succinivibrio sp.]|jgi:riboflavin synthase|nr:riboflavin synthase [Succinivibrio sp.]MBR1612423.1 riboflavin synthase [Succinivibrio sp.]
MFTGIVEAVGTLEAMTAHGRGYEIIVKTPSSFLLKQRVKLGDSIANNGVCLTVTRMSGDCFYADVSAETVAHTAFCDYKRGCAVNLELACTPSTHLGGHIVQGHVDGVGTVVKKQTLDEAYDIYIRAPQDILRYIAKKGSIAVNGVSLTVNDIENDVFRLTLIPHTQNTVDFSGFEPGSKVNLEVDVLARYLERLIEAKSEKKTQSSGISMSTLIKNGFV